MAARWFRSAGPLVVFIFGGALSACDAQDELYRLGQVTQLSLSRSSAQKAVLTYRPLSESLYYSPGIQWIAGDAGVEVRFLRCGIKESCATDYRATRGADGVLSVQVPLTSLPVIVSDGATKRALALTE